MNGFRAMIRVLGIGLPVGIEVTCNAVRACDVQAARQSIFSAKTTRATVHLKVNPMLRETCQKATERHQ